MEEHGHPNLHVDLPEGIEPHPYRIEGHFLEVCDCFTICPCWSGREPDDAACSGVFA